MERKTVRNRLGILLLAAVCSGCIRDGEEPVSVDALETGDKLPVFSVELNNGDTLDNEAVKGKVGVLAFFRVACPDCRTELPVIQRLYETYANDSRVCIAGINWKEEPDQADAYWQSENLAFPYAVRCEDSVYEAFACQVVPQIYISDASQTIRYIYGDNPVATFEQLQDAVEDCLAAE